MNAISILEQQRADEVLRLEIAYSNLYRAYISGNREEMIAKYVAAGNVNLPHLQVSPKSFDFRHKCVLQGLADDTYRHALSGLIDCIGIERFRHLLAPRRLYDEFR